MRYLEADSKFVEYESRDEHKAMAAFADHKGERIYWIDQWKCPDDGRMRFVGLGVLKCSHGRFLVRGHASWTCENPRHTPGSYTEGCKRDRHDVKMAGHLRLHVKAEPNIITNRRV